MLVVLSHAFGLIGGVLVYVGGFVVAIAKKGRLLFAGFLLCARRHATSGFGILVRT